MMANNVDMFENKDQLIKILKENAPMTKEEEDAVIKIMLDPKYPERIRLLSRNKLIQSHSRLVYAVASMYARHRRLGISDLYQAGIMGMLGCAQDYDPDKGVKFTSYAIWWIKQKMKEEIHRIEDSIHTPMYSREMTEKKVREGTIDLDDEKTLSIYNAMAPILSIDKPVSNYVSSVEGDTLTMGDTIAEEDEEFSNIESRDMDQKLGEILKESLDPLDYDLIRKTFLGTFNQDEIGVMMSLGGERIRQKKTRAIARAQNILKKAMSEKNFVYENDSVNMSVDRIFNPDKKK